MTEQRCCRISRDHRCLQHRTQEVTSLKRQTKQNVIGNVHLKSAVTGSKSVIKTKNEQVVGRNIYQRARPCIGIECANREKLGFPVPVRDWLKEEPYASKVWSAFKSPVAEQFFHTRYLTKMLKNHLTGRQDNWRQIWCVYMFLLWYQEYFVKR